ncbi:hypothetical protein D3C76_1176100 [compost metagenome]
MVSMFFLSKPNKSKVFTITSKARVESSPPDIPITAFLDFVCSNLFAKAED